MIFTKEQQEDSGALKDVSLGQFPPDQPVEISGMDTSLTNDIWKGKVWSRKSTRIGVLGIVVICVSFSAISALAVLLYESRNDDLISTDSIFEEERDIPDDELMKIFNDTYSEYTTTEDDNFIWKAKEIEEAIMENAMRSGREGTSTTSTKENEETSTANPNSSGNKDTSTEIANEPDNQELTGALELAEALTEVSQELQELEELLKEELQSANDFVAQMNTSSSYTIESASTTFTELELDHLNDTDYAELPEINVVNTSDGIFGEESDLGYGKTSEIKYHNNDDEYEGEGLFDDPVTQMNISSNHTIAAAATTLTELELDHLNDTDYVELPGINVGNKSEDIFGEESDLGYGNTSDIKYDYNEDEDEDLLFNDTVAQMNISSNYAIESAATTTFTELELDHLNDTGYAELTEIDVGNTSDGIFGEESDLGYGKTSEIKYHNNDDEYEDEGLFDDPVTQMNISSNYTIAAAATSLIELELDHLNDTDYVELPEIDAGNTSDGIFGEESDLGYGNTSDIKYDYNEDEDEGEGLFDDPVAQMNISSTYTIAAAATTLNKLELDHLNDTGYVELPEIDVVNASEDIFGKESDLGYGKTSEIKYDYNEDEDESEGLFNDTVTLMNVSSDDTMPAAAIPDNEVDLHLFNETDYDEITEVIFSEGSELGSGNTSQIIHDYIEDEGKGLFDDSDDPTPKPQQDDVEMVPKREWGGVSPEVLNLQPEPSPYVVITQTDSAPCFDQDSCSLAMRLIQTFSINEEHLPDMCDNYYIGGDGKVYVGRGTNVTNCHIGFVRLKNIAISFIGDFDEYEPTAVQVKALKKLISVLVSQQVLNPDYKIIAHKEISLPQSIFMGPGKYLLDKINSMAHRCSYSCIDDIVSSDYDDRSSDSNIIFRRYSD